MNIVLCGMMGAGKTSVGVKIAETTGRRWYDTDQMIIDRYGNISDIFEYYGEEYFRKLESGIVKELSKEENLIISTGGGLVLKRENNELLQQNGKIVFLRASLDTLVKRLKVYDNRPLLQADSGVIADKLAELLRVRMPVYEHVADFIVDVDGKSVEESAAAVIQTVALAFLKKGYRVCAAYSSDEDSARETAEAGVEIYRADVTEEEEIKTLFQTIGGVDILVNNAGISLVKQIQDVTIEEWNRLFAVNVTGAFLCTREALKGMISKKSGLVVNISSVWGEVGGSCESAYSASKAALLGFTKALSKELGWSGIRVNCVSPGVIDTRMNAHFSKEDMAALKEEIPAGRLGTGEDVAKTVLFLEENDYVTGADIPVNGGFSVV